MGRKPIIQGPALGLGLVAVWLAAAACPVSEARRVCLEVVASPNLNLHDGQAHSLTVHLYPLVSPLGFEQTSVSDLLEGKSPPGMAGPSVPRGRRELS